MKKTLFYILPALVLSCGGNDPAGPSGPVEVTVYVSPSRIIMDLGGTQLFTANVYGSSNTQVVWRVEDIIGGNSAYGTIDELGQYEAPLTEPDIDSVKITAVPTSDLSKIGTAWAIMVDPSRIYVSTTGSDSTGSGSRNLPYRTITHAASVATMNQAILIGPGVYDQAGGEIFPIGIGTGVTVDGAGQDSTFVIGPGDALDLTGSVFSFVGDAITIRDLNISTTDADGVGIWIADNQWVSIVRNRIGPNRIGIAVNGLRRPRQIIDNNVITVDSIGIAAGDSSEPIIRNNMIDSCGTYGIRILDSASPDIGRNDTTEAGGNTIRNCGSNNHYLIYNDSPDSVWAIGNTWVFPNPVDNDQFIRDDDETGGTAGRVILLNQ